MLQKLVPVLLLFGICNATLVINLYRGDLKIKIGSNITVTEGDAFKLVCSDVSSQISDVIWNKVETIKDVNNSFVMQSPLTTSEPSVLDFKSILLQDEGRYWCTDKVDEELTSVYINVTAAHANGGQRKPVQTKTSFVSFENGAEVNENHGDQQPELIILQQTQDGEQIAPSTITTNMGDKMILICAMKGINDTIDYDVNWHKLEIAKRKDTAQKMYIKKSMNGIEPPKLMIDSISMDDVGRYVCSKNGTKLFQSVYMKVVVSEPTTPPFSAPMASPNVCPPTAMDDSHRQAMEEVRKGLESIIASSQELLKKLPEPISAA